MDICLRWNRAVKNKDELSGEAGRREQGKRGNLKTEIQFLRGNEWAHRSDHETISKPCVRKDELHESLTFSQHFSRLGTRETRPSGVLKTEIRFLLSTFYSLLFPVWHRLCETHAARG